MGSINRAHARCCEEADLASLGWICVTEQRCTDAALVLDVFYTCSSGLRKRPHRMCTCIVSSTLQMGSINRAHVRCCKEADLASLGWILGGSNTPSRRSRRSARARRIYACCSSRKKRPHRSICALHRRGPAVRLSHFSALGFFVGPKRNINGP